MNDNINNKFIYYLYQKEELDEFLFSNKQKELALIKQMLKVYFSDKKKEKVAMFMKYKLLN